MIHISKSSATRQNIMQWIGNIYYDPFTSQYSRFEDQIIVNAVRRIIPTGNQDQKSRP